MYNKSEHTPAPISEEVLASLGADHLVYVKPFVINGQMLYGIYSATGTQVATAPSRDIAFALAIQNGVEPVSVH